VTTAVLSGLGVGAIYAMVALCIAIAMTATGVFNFAQPQYVMLGGYIASSLSTSTGASFIATVALCALVGGALGAVQDIVGIRPLRNGPSHASLVTTVGFAVAIQGISIVLWGTTPRTVPSPMDDALFGVFGAHVRVTDLVLLGVAVGTAAIAHLFSTRTRWGMAGRAATFDPITATVRGINVTGISTVAFAVAGAVSVAAGPLVALRAGVSPELGNNLVILAFVGLALGGFGSYWGCLAGGLAVGFVQSLGGLYLGSEAPMVLLFSILLVALMLKPNGLADMGSTRRV
jgi:branched-chain amino acid transport system permease protein